MIRVIYNRKGGVGKSTLTCNLAAVAAHAGKRTLVIDLDPQANTTHYLGSQSSEGITAFDFFNTQISYRAKKHAPAAYLRDTEFDNLQLIAARSDLIELEPQLATRHKIYKFRDLLQELRGEFDEIYIDTPPALNFFTLSALIAADRCLVPFDCDAFAHNALLELLDTLEEVRDDHNPSLSLDGIVVNQFQARARLPQEAIDELIEAGLPVLEPYISSSIKVKESHRACKPMIFLDSSHKISRELRGLYQTLQAL